MLTRGKSQAAEAPKRFYRAAASGEVEGGHGVLLDGRAVRTPLGKRLVLPTVALAALVAEEWDRQGEHILIGGMHATRLAYTTLDAAADARGPLADEVARWAGSDAICYFADGPNILVERELIGWGSLLDWAQAALGLEFVRAAGVIHQGQPPQTIERVRSLAHALDDFHLTGVAMAAGLFGSAVLALALQRGRLDGGAAFDLSRLDEAFQEEQWGEDAEAAVRTVRMRSEALMLERWFQALT